MTQYVDNKRYDFVAREANESAQRLGILSKKLNDTHAHYIERDGDVIGITSLRYAHAYYYANAYGGYILCCDDDYEGNAIESFGDVFLELGYSGLIRSPEELIADGATFEDLDESYYPYNGGEMYIDMPVILERIY